MTSLKLPLLAAHDDALQKCVFCPKLSRAACPVSNVEHNETLTPWGKMSIAYFAARGDVPIDAEHAEPAWACSGCYGCRERCDHRNEVATTLYDARAEMFQAGVAPASVMQAHERLDEAAGGYAAMLDRLDPQARADATTAVVLGCGFARLPEEEAADVWALVQRLCGPRVRAVRACCGLPRLHVGDRPGLRRAAYDMLDETRGVERVVAADPGCARALMEDWPRLAVGPQPPVVPLVDVIYARLNELPGASAAGPFRYHDACQLGRGLGRYEEPRAILARLTGEPPGELPRNRTHGECSGAGGMLPVTRPEASQAIADERIAEHRQAGGGTLISACPSSVQRFRSRGEEAQNLYAAVEQGWRQASAGAGDPAAGDPDGP